MSLYSSTLRCIRAYCGPSIVVIYFSVNLFSYVTVIPLYTAIHFVVFAIGLIICVVDLGDFLRQTVRTSLRKHIENVSLDDILQSIHNAESFIAGNVVGSCLGQLAMYGLPCSNEQKVRFVQSGLDLADREKARRLLLEPGEWKCLLPNTAQNWIFQNSVKTDREFRQLTHSSDPPITTTPLESDFKCNISISSSDLDVSDFYEREKSRIRNNSFVQEVSSLIGVKVDTEEQPPLTSVSHENKNIGMASEKAAQETDTTMKSGPSSQEAKSDSAASNTSPLPVDVFFSVAKEMVTDRLKDSLSNLQTSRALDILAASSSVLLLGQLGLSHRTRKMVWSLLRAVTTASLAGTWTISMACLAAKHQSKLSEWSGHPSFLANLSSIVKSLTGKLKGSRAKGIVAVIIIMLFKRWRTGAIKNS